MSLWIRTTILTLGLAAAACADPLLPPDVAAAAATIIDGALSEPAWKKAITVELAETAMPLRPATSGTQTTLRMMTSGGTLYVGAECLFPSGAALKSERREHDAPVFEDESLEIFIACNGGPQPTNYYHFALNTSGSTTERHILDPAWNTDWQSAVAVGQDRWTAELAIPLAALGGGSAAGHYWQINVCRNLYDAHGSFAQGWTLARPGYHSPQVLMLCGPIGAPALLTAVNTALTDLEVLKAYLVGSDKKQYHQLIQYRDKLETAKDTTLLPAAAVEILETAWRNAGQLENAVILNYMFE